MASNDEDNVVKVASELAEKNVRIHTAKMRPKDKKERHLKHDDCCRYCERYCDDKITEIKRREIEAWRSDVPETRDQNLRNRDTKIRPRLKFLQHEIAELPHSEHGFRRVKTPKELRPLKNGKSQKNKQSRRDVVADTEVISLKMTDLSLKPQRRRTRHENVEDSEEYRLSELIKSPVMSRTFSRDSLETSSHSEFDRLSEPLSQHSNRSCSNELLNVITIDDAIKHHRDQLIKSNEIRVIKTSEKPTRNVMLGDDQQGLTVTAPMDTQIAETNRSQPLHKINVISTSQEFRLHPNTPAHSRPISKTSLAPTESTELNMSKPASATSCRPTTQKSDVEYQKVTAQQRPLDVIVRAVDDIVSDRCIHDEKIYRSSHRSEKNKWKAITTKPESHRFRKMNRRLKELIEEHYLFNSRMAARLHKYKFHGNTSLHHYRGSIPGSRSGGYHSEMAMYGRTPDSGYSHPGHDRLSQRYTNYLPQNSTSKFLEVLSDYRDPEIQII